MLLFAGSKADQVEVRVFVWGLISTEPDKLSAIVVQFPQQPFLRRLVVGQDQELVMSMNKIGIGSHVGGDGKKGLHPIGESPIIKKVRVCILHGQRAVFKKIEARQDIALFVMIHFEEGDSAGIDQRQVRADGSQPKRFLKRRLGENREHGCVQREDDEKDGRRRVSNRAIAAQTETQRIAMPM